MTFPDGLFSFTISGLSPGATVTVTVTLPSPLPAGSFSYWKFQTGAWSRFSSASLDSTRTIITLTFTADASGTVTDPGGPVIVPPPSAGPVGGVVEPVNKLVVFAPYVALLGLVSAVTVVVAKPRKKHEN
ncbi:MAG: choice-of-anchor U domain-containing protein [Candidatus Bathyarchaeia archaeon]